MDVPGRGGVCGARDGGWEAVGVVFWGGGFGRVGDFI